MGEDFRKNLGESLMMHTLMITSPICTPWNNGTKNITYSMATNCKDVKFTLLTTKNSNLKNNNIIFKKIYTIDKPIVPLLQKFYLFSALIKKDDADIYHFIFKPNIITSIFSRFILKLKKKKSLQTITNIIPSVSNPKKFAFADYLVLTSDYMKDRFLKAGIKNVFKINPSIDLDKFKPSKKSQVLLDKFKIKKKDLVVLYAADYSFSKGVDYLFEAMPFIIKCKPNVKFILAFRIRNDFERRREIMLKIEVMCSKFSDKIIFLRTVNDMCSLINICDISILPLLNTVGKVDIPLTLLESLALKKPIIITNVKPLNEIMKSKVGIIVEPRNPVALSDAITSLLKNTKLRRKMGEEGRRMVSKYFNVKNTALEYQALYKRLMEE